MSAYRMNACCRVLSLVLDSIYPVFEWLGPSLLLCNRTETYIHICVCVYKQRPEESNVIDAVALWGVESPVINPPGT